MKIALINPNLNGDYPQPHLGLLSIAGACRQKGYGVIYIDANIRNLKIGAILREVECADIVGITATSLFYQAAYSLAWQIRSAYPQRFMILGGIHGSLFADEIIKEGLFDAVVTGEGEKVIYPLLELQHKGAYGSSLIDDLDELPDKPYELLNGFKPRMAYGKHQHFMPIYTARGCPFSCSFCSNVIFGRKYRARSVDSVIAEINRLHNDFGINEIKIYDDVFTMRRERAKEIAQQINSKVAWSCMTRVNLVDQTLLKEMKKGGCYSIAYGLESGNADILKSISKNTTLEQGEQAVRYSQEAGLKVIGYFMLGAPGETLDTIDQTVDYAIKLKLNHAQFSIATALPGSELYQHVAPEQRAYSYAMPDSYNPSICDLSPAQLKIAQARAYKRFGRGK